MHRGALLLIHGPEPSIGHCLHEGQSRRQRRMATRSPSPFARDMVADGSGSLATDRDERPGPRPMETGQGGSSLETQMGHTTDIIVTGPLEGGSARFATAAPPVGLFVDVSSHCWDALDFGLRGAGTAAGCRGQRQQGHCSARRRAFFDSVSKPNLRKALEHLRAPSCLVRLIDNFYDKAERVFCLQGAFSATWQQVFAGIAQGCPLSPLLAGTFTYLWAIPSEMYGHMCFVNLRLLTLWPLSLSNRGNPALDGVKHHGSGHPHHQP